MAVERLSTRFRVRNDVWDSITPNNIRQRDISSPNGEWKPAPWLPIQWTQSNRDAGTDAFVISSGKVVAQDSLGYLVPAGLRGTFLGDPVAPAVGDIALTYTSTDADYGVIDLVSGQRYATAGTTNYTVLQVAEALVELGFVDPAVAGGPGAGTAPTTIAHAVAINGDFISKAVGIAAYDFYVWSGRPEDGDQYFTNYSKQHLVQFLTEAQMIVPARVAGSTGADAVVFDTGANALVAGAQADGVSPAAGEVWDAAAAASLSRYTGVVDAADPLVAVQLANRALAVITDRTPMVADTTGVLTRKRSSISAISQEGDYWLDAEIGLLFLHSDTQATLDAATATVTFTYQYYSDALAGASAHRYVHFDGIAKCGGELGFDAQSNFVMAGSAADISQSEVVGRLHYADIEPKDLLDTVKTAFNLSNMPAGGKMPGSATKGFSDRITLSQEPVADRSAVILVRI
jgi:hypothetical protein